MRIAFLLALAVMVAGCRSTQHHIANAIEPCNGRIVRSEFVVLRNAAIHELLTELASEPGQIVVSRAAVVAHPLVSGDPDWLVKAAGPALADVVVDQHDEAECWPQGDLRLQWASDSGRAGEGYWTAFRRANPAVAGVLSVETPVIFRTGQSEELAAMLADFRCGDMCGGIWLVILRREASKWTRVSVRGLLNY
jgi:hypothetical protein